MTRLSSPQFVLVLLVCSTFAAFFELGRQDVWSANEGQRAAPPAEMLRTGNFVVPTLNGEIYLAKPPLLYWAIAGVYSITGEVSEWTARIPTAACSVLMVLCLYLLTRRLTGEAPARWAALAMAACPYFLERSRWAELDVPLTLTTFLAVALAYRSWIAPTRGSAWGQAILAGLALSAATMLKGPVPYLFLFSGYVAFLSVESDAPEEVLRKCVRLTLSCIVLAVLIMLVNLVISVPFPAALAVLVMGWLILAVPHAKTTLRATLPLLLCTLLLGVGIVTPWAIAVVHDQGWDNIHRLLNSEVVDRTHTATSINSGSPFFYLIALPFMTFPWGFLLPAQISRRLWAQGDRTYRFSLICGWFSVAVFSLIAGKEYEYIMPAIPFLLIAVGYLLTWAETDALPADMAPWFLRWRKGFRIALTFFCVGLSLYGIVMEYDPMLLVECGVLAVLSLGVGLYGVGGTITRKQTRIFVLALLLIVNGLLITRSYHYRGEHSPKTLALVVRQLIEKGYALESSKIYPEFTFYAAHPIAEVIEPEAVKKKMSQEAPYFYLTRDKFAKEFSGGAGNLSFLAGPWANKDLVLIGNPAAQAAFKALPDNPFLNP